MPDSLEQILTALFVAAATAYVTVYLALRRFHAERWWERKAAAYDRLLGALADLKRHADHRVEEHEGTTFSDDYSKVVSDMHREASHELERAGILGGYTFSDRTARALAKLLADDNAKRLETPHEFFARVARAYESAIAEITAAAKEDLRVDADSEL